MRTAYLLDREVERVLDLLTPDNRLVMRVCLHTGLRVGDVLALRTAQLRPNFWVTEEKTGKRRQVGIPEPLLTDLRANGQPEGWCFPGADPRKHRTRQAVWKDVKRAAYALRLNCNAAPHSARKVYAVELLKKYGDVERVRRALNHSSVEVTLIYAMADKLHDAPARRRRPAAGRNKA